MKRTIIANIALVLSIVGVALTGSDSRVGAQNQVKVVGDTGLVRLGPNQLLRVAAAPGDVDGADFLAFQRIGYTQNNCNGGVCKYSAATQTSSDPMAFLPGEAGFIDIWFDDSAAVRVIVRSNRRNSRVTASIVDIPTGKTTSHIIMANTEGDFH